MSGLKAIAGPLGAIGDIASLLSGVIKAGMALLMRKDNIELGQARQASVDRQAADAARQRMDEAAAKPSNREETQDALDKGGF